MAEKQPAPYPLRISPALREQLDKAADAAGRSLNQEIAARLEESLSIGQPAAALASLDRAYTEAVARVGEFEFQANTLREARLQAEAQARAAAAIIEELRGSLDTAMRRADKAESNAEHLRRLLEERREEDSKRAPIAIEAALQRAKLEEEVAELRKELANTKLERDKLHVYNIEFKRQLDTALHLPARLKAKLVKASQLHGRSLTEEVAIRLEADESREMLAPVLARLERDLAQAELEVQTERLRVWMTAATLKPLIKDLPDDAVLEGPLDATTVSQWRGLVDAFMRMSKNARSAIDTAWVKLKKAEESLPSVSFEDSFLNLFPAMPHHEREELLDAFVKARSSPKPPDHSDDRSKSAELDQAPHSDEDLQHLINVGWSVLNGEEEIPAEMLDQVVGWSRKEAIDESTRYQLWNLADRLRVRALRQSHAAKGQILRLSDLPQVVNMATQALNTSSAHSWEISALIEEALKLKGVKAGTRETLKNLEERLLAKRRSWRE